jgi:hypothetical protein
MADNGTVTGMAALVPDVYFDLISRIPPGALVLGMLISQTAPNTMTAPLVEMAKASWAHAIAVLFLALGASYVAGLMLSRIGLVFGARFFNAFVRSVNEADQSLLSKFSEDIGLGPVDGKKITFWAAYKTLMEYLRVKEPAGQAIRTKMLAESALCVNLLAAISLALLCWSIADGILTVFTSPAILCFLMPVFLLALLSTRHRTSRAFSRHIEALRVMIALNGGQLPVHSRAPQP